VFVVSICLAFSAFYELIEWWVAVLSGENAEAFLGTQGTYGILNLIWELPYLGLFARYCCFQKYMINS